MEINFYGGCREVGRSAFLLENEHDNLLLDCGIKLGTVTEYPQIPEDVITRIRNIAITHTHLDHIGFLPHKFANEKTRIFATKPTRDLMHVLLADYEHLQKEKAFVEKDVNRIMKKINIAEFNEQVGVGKDLSFRFLNAGHILGSAMIDVNRGKLLYTGDFNTTNTKILNGCSRDIRADNLVIESTYGGNNDSFPSQKETVKQFAESINRTIKAGAIVLIPSFAVGRGQEILLMLADLMKNKTIEECPIYIDGMIKKANRIYRQNVIYARRELQVRILMNEEDPFKSKYFKISEKKDRSDLQTPCIIVTTSGMVSGGPIINYLRMFGNDASNKMIFVGYQADGTNGRKIMDGDKEIEFNGEKIKVNTQVEMHRFSGHCDRNALISFVKGVKGLKKVFLVHGEEKKCSELAEALGKKLEVIIPRIGEGFRV